MIFDTHNRGGYVQPIRCKFRDSAPKTSFSLATWAALGGAQPPARADMQLAQKLAVSKKVIVSAASLAKAKADRIASNIEEVERLKARPAYTPKAGAA